MNGRAAAVVGEKAVFLGDGLDGQFRLRMIRDLIAGREADTDERRGCRRVGAGFLCGGETDLHMPVFLRNDVAEAEGGFGGGDVALAGDHETLNFKL